MTRRRALWILAALLLSYVGSYLILSRRGDAWCEPKGFCGFLYVLPHDTKHWYELHQFCYVFYLPVNEVDRWFGGRYPVRSISFGLSLIDEAHS